jgi:anaerobic selenocysteine-containing dehydrogenase
MRVVSQNQVISALSDTEDQYKIYFQMGDYILTTKDEGTQIIKSVCMLCYMVCGIDAYVKNGKLVKVCGMKEHPATKGTLCPRGINLPNYVYSPDRIKYPMMRDEKGELQRVSWDKALDTIASKVQNIKDIHGARSVALSVGSIGAENILISAFAQRWRGAFGTPNFFSIEGHCFRARIMARLFTFGTYPLSDLDSAECVVLWGHNPDGSEPPVAERLHKLVDKGLKIIAIDPKRIPLAKKGIHIPIRPGSDAALALGMINVIISENLYDKEFVNKYTEGFDKLKDHVQAYTPEKVSTICGVPSVDIQKISRLFAKAKGACIEQGINTLDQHINGFQNSRLLAILQAVTGNYNRPGGWCTNPLMRLSDLRLPVEGKPLGAEEHPVFHSFWGMTSPYGQQMVLPDAILTEKPYPVKAMLVSAGNPVASWPDSKKIAESFKKLDLLVVSDVFMNETARLADIVLPVCSSAETMGLAYNYALTMGIPFAMLNKKLIEPIGESRPDWWIYSQLGRKMGYDEFFPWNTDEEVVEHMLEASKLSINELTKGNPEGVMFGERSYVVPDKVRTPSSKIELFSQSLADFGEDPIPVHKEPTQSPISDPNLVKKYPCIMMSGARIPEYTHWQMKTIPELRRSAPEPVAWVNPDTAKEAGVADGDKIYVETRSGKIEVTAELTEDMMPGIVSLTHGWENEFNANNLTELDDRDPVTGYCEFRNLACRIKKV